MIRSRPAWAALEGAIAGDVVLPGSSDYDLARKPAIPRFHDVRPRAVVRCAAPEDVVETIAFARRSRLATATRSGGHCFAGRSSTPGIVIDVSTMRAVSVAGGVATVGAGARLGDVYDTLDDHGITIPAGCGPSVGIAGLTLGGGLGILGRKHGLTSDHLVGAQVVLADGRVVDCDQHRHDQLFWALRGAGGCNFGVVTCLEFSTIPAPAATSFQLTWRHAQAAPIIDAWLRWAPVGPEELAASLLVTATGDGDEPPVVNLIGAMLGTEAETDALLDELISDAVPEPLSATRRGLSYRQAKRFLAGLGEESSSHGHSFSKSEFFRRPLPGEAVARLVELLAQGRARGESRELDFTPWGGAYNRIAVDATAFAHRHELFLLKHEVIVDPQAATPDRQAALGWLDRSWSLARPWGSGGVYPNFPDPALPSWKRAYHGENYGRLVRLKGAYDPTGFFRFRQAVPLA